jgi:hypothetical protein
MHVPASRNYAESGTLHGNINPNAVYADSTTGRGFLVDWEYPTGVVTPGDYVPFCASTVSYVVAFSSCRSHSFWKCGLDKWGKPKSRQEIMEKLVNYSCHELFSEGARGKAAGPDKC